MDPQQPYTPAPTPQTPAGPPQPTTQPAQQAYAPVTGTTPQPQAPSGPQPVTWQPEAVQPVNPAGPWAPNQQAPAQPPTAGYPAANGATPNYGAPAANTAFYAGAPTAQAHKNNKTIKIVIIAGVAFVVLTFAAIFILAFIANVQKRKNAAEGTSSTSNSASATDSTAAATADVVDRKDGTLDLGTLINPQTTIKDQAVKAKLNQQLNMSDGLSYMITSVDRNFVANSKYLKATDGKELIKVNVVFGNRAKSSDRYMSGNDFALKNSSGGLQQYEYATADEVPDVLKGTNVEPGKQAKGSIIFKVDKNEKISIVTEEKYTNYTTKKDVSVTSEVTP